MTIATIVWENRNDGTVATSRDGVNFSVPSLTAGEAASFDRIRTKWIEPIRTVLADLKSPVPERVVLAIIKSESNGNDRIISPAGAVGLMQVMPSTARLTTAQLMNADTNLRAGIKYLDSLQSDANDLPAVASMYNAGSNPLNHRPWSNAESNPNFQSEYGFRSNAGYIDHVVRANNYAITGTIGTGPTSGGMGSKGFVTPLLVGLAFIAAYKFGLLDGR